MRLRLGLAVVVVLSLISCGGDGSNPAIANVTITPASASVQAGSSLILNGNAVGFGNEPLRGWWMDEAPGRPGALYCGLDFGDPVPLWTDCPCGYIMFDTKSNGVPNEAVYHAPPNPGVFHPVFQVSAHDGFVVGLTRSTKAEITVTP